MRRAYRKSSAIAGAPKMRRRSLHRTLSSTVTDCRSPLSAASDARFDVYARRGEGGFLLDCQADLLSDLNTRFVVPLLSEADAPRPATRLNPIFEIGGTRTVMVTQYASAIPVRELGELVASLAAREHEIVNALDMLIVGF